MSPIIYPARRAVEHAVSLSGIRPLRLFPVLWPLWQIETTAQVLEENDYDIIDRFLIRAIATADICVPAELARFLGLPPPLVQRGLAFLTLIGHLTESGGQVALTELGAEALRSNIRYQPSESRQILLTDKLTGQPLPRRYYQGRVTVLDTGEVPAGRLADRSRFLRLFAPAPFQPGTMAELARRPDRAEYNLPARLRDLEVRSVRDGYLPAYLVETADHGLLVYSAVAEGRDAFLEKICRDAGDFGHRISAEGLRDPRSVWTDWLAQQASLGPGLLSQLPSGLWRATFPPASFGGPAKLPVTRVGSYELRQHYFIQFWCEDAELRRRAVLERALGLAQLRDVDTRSGLVSRSRQIAGALAVAAPTIEEIRSYATITGAHDRLAHLDALAP